MATSSEMDVRAAEAGAALDELATLYTVYYQDSGNMEAYRAWRDGYNKIGDMSPDWLRALLAERERLVAVVEAARRLLTAVEFDEDRAKLYIQMPDTEYSFDMTENIKNPIADAIIRLSAEVDALDKLHAAGAAASDAGQGA